MDLEPPEDDAATLAFLLNGRRPKYRRSDRRRTRPPEPTILSSPDACESEYQRLLYSQTHLSLDDLRLEEFTWATAGISTTTRRRGSRRAPATRTKGCCSSSLPPVSLPRTPGIWWSYSERGPNVTIMTALRTRQTTISAVQRLKDEQAG